MIRVLALHCAPWDQAPMGSYCAITFDDLEICIAKSGVPEDFAALFQESDRAPQPAVRSEDEPYETTYRYTASRETLLRRLGLLGATREAAELAFEQWLKAEREQWAECVAEGWGGETAAAAAALTLAEWNRRVPQVLATRYKPDLWDREPADQIDARLRDEDISSSWLWFGGYGSPISLRLILEACTEIAAVTLDMSELVANGYYETERPLALEARHSVFTAYNPLSPTLILGEGSSDLAVLRLSLPVFYPELADYLTFFNHAELNVEGGAGFLVKMLKAFAGAQMTDRMVAVFDNDTAGRVSMRQAQALKLPANMVVTCLPDCETAKAYPTIGPQGEHVMDVNGLAAGIEMYLSREALTRDGELRRVRWTGYDKGADAYQGEVEGKADVFEAFKARLAMVANPAEAQVAFPDLARVWEHLIDLIEGAAEAARLRNWVRLQREF